MFAAAVGILWLIFEAFKDDWWFDRGGSDVKWLDVFIQFSGATLLEVGMNDWNWWYVIPAICINGALRLWFDPLINCVRGKGFWHLGKNIWDQWINQFEKWQQILIRTVFSLTGIVIFFYWPLIILVIK